MRYTFRIDGLPPKKDGANSMWGKKSERERLVKLRRAAWEAVEGGPVLEKNIHLSLTVYVGTTNNRLIGDLDTFITGVCDGLMCSAPRANLAGWGAEELADISPHKAIAIRDDCQVMSISAKKLTGHDPTPWYEVALEGE